MTSPIKRQILHAEVVYNGLGTPRQDGAVVVQEEGGRNIIVDITDFESAKRIYQNSEVVDVGFAI